MTNSAKIQMAFFRVWPQL